MNCAYLSQSEVKEKNNKFLNSLINNKNFLDVTFTRNVNIFGYLNDHNYTGTAAADLMRLYFKTLNQSASHMWFSLRWSRITASFVGEVVKSMKKLRKCETLTDF